VTPLIEAVVDLDAALGGESGLLIAGGLGLYLKQQHLQATGARTLVPLDRLPSARTTQDVDLFLPAAVIASVDRSRSVRAALDSLKFHPVTGAEFLKFRRGIDACEVTIDLLVGPVGAHRHSIEFKGGRARPLGISGRDAVHAHYTPEALGVEAYGLPVRCDTAHKAPSGTRCIARVPCAFSCVLMKLAALEDRIHHVGKGFGRHHAVDLYRIVAMLTEEDERVSGECALQHASDDGIACARARAQRLFEERDGLGRVRLLEGSHGTAPLGHADVDFLLSELMRMLS